MAKAANEQARLDNLNHYQILDSLPEEAWDNITQLASAICETPICAISFIDKERQWFKSIVGLEASETSRDVAFCAHTILESDVMVVENATLDPRFQNNPFVVDDPAIRFYAGAQIVSPEGFSLGALCVIDKKERRLSPEQTQALRLLSYQVTQLLDLHRKKRELELALKLERIARQAKDQFLSAMSHELRTPLNAIIGFSELTEMDILDLNLSQEERHHILEQLQLGRRAGHQLLEAFDNILTLVSINEGQLAVHPSSIKLYALTKQLAEEFQDNFEMTQNRIKIDCDPELTVHTDANYLSFMLRQLLSNAYKFTTQGDIHITVQDKGPEVSLQISDTGCGIAPEIQPHIFEPFYKGSTNNTVQGIGMGLAVVKQLIQALKGSISLKSQPGQGSQFELMLPREFKHE